ncbi:hypothetical protein L1049_016027 [Liquidambar formosana]|uniref:Cyclin-dependent kinase inhibitor domain-containing protein n=1 Tax=Liquidambar formosana TaxID=63359 RepID=A0AAP0RZ16_LIQFO
MGKYMRKGKTTGEVAVMEVSQSSLGVRTRAKTLALQRLQKSAAAAAAAAAAPASSGSYLQLRSRRLEKPPALVAGHDSKRQRQTTPKESCIQNPNPNPRASSRLRVAGSVTSGSVGCLNEEGQSTKEEEATQKVEGKEEETQEENNNNNNIDGGIEASFGENVLEFEGRERSTRESTPCSLIRDPDTIRTPGSTTRPTTSIETNRRIQNSTRRHIPTAHEMDEFFAGAEEQQQRQFIEKYTNICFSVFCFQIFKIFWISADCDISITCEAHFYTEELIKYMPSVFSCRYNFDPVNDKPLPGRYEWVKLDP